MSNPIDIPVTAEQFMRDANEEAREANKVCAMLGISPMAIPYPDVENKKEEK